MKLDISAEHLVEINNILKTCVPNREVVAFGSRVKQMASPTSDLDLCVMGDMSLSFSELAELRLAFSESDIPYRVDIVDWATTNIDFQDIIQRDAVVIYSPLKC